jgi:hypothetical protein
MAHVRRVLLLVCCLLQGLGITDVELLDTILQAAAAAVLPVECSQLDLLSTQPEAPVNPNHVWQQQQQQQQQQQRDEEQQWGASQLDEDWGDDHWDGDADEGDLAWPDAVAAVQQPQRGDWQQQQQQHTVVQQQALQPLSANRQPAASMAPRPPQQQQQTSITGWTVRQPPPPQQQQQQQRDVKQQWRALFKQPKQPLGSVSAAAVAAGRVSRQMAFTRDGGLAPAAHAPPAARPRSAAEQAAAAEVSAAAAHVVQSAGPALPR